MWKQWHSNSFKQIRKKNLPFYLRKRPGGKNVKANITQGGRRSRTFTTGSKKGKPRVNFNTKRGISFSIPGTGFVWRQKGYGKSEYKSVVEERGYDLRTKEGRLKAEEENNRNTFIYLVIGIGLAVGWFSDERLYGFIASYLTFFIFLPFGTNSGPGTYVWAILAHIFGAIGYGVSWLFVTDWLEPTVIGIIVGTFVSSIILNGLMLTAFIAFFFSALWALIGEPSLYLQDVAGQISHQLNAAFNDIFAMGLTPKLSTVGQRLGSIGTAIPERLNFLLNGVGILFWCTNILGAIMITFLSVKKSSLSTFSKLCLVPISFSVLILTIAASLLRGETMLADENEFTLYTRASILASSIVFSICPGYLLCRIYVHQNNVATGFFNSFLASLLCIFWLPLFVSTRTLETIETVHKKQKNNNNNDVANATITASAPSKQFETQLESVLGLGKKEERKSSSIFPHLTFFWRQTHKQYC